MPDQCTLSSLPLRFDVFDLDDHDTGRMNHHTVWPAGGLEKIITIPDWEMKSGGK